MGIVTLGSKANDTQSLWTGYHSFSPIICGPKASLDGTEEALKQGAKSARLLALASLSHWAHPVFVRCIQVTLAGSNNIVFLNP